MCSDCKPPRIRRQSRGVSRVASLVVAHSSSPTYGSATTRGTRAAAQQLIDQRTFARTQDQPSCQKQTWSSRPLKESRLVVMRAGWSAPYARHNKKMVLGLVPPFDHCAETDFVQRIASPGDSTRKSIHDHADKKTNRRERNTIRTNIAGQRTTSARDQVGKPKRPLQRRWRLRCAEHSSSKWRARVPARNRAKVDWDSPAAKMRSNKTLCDTKRQIVQISPAPLPPHVIRTLSNVVRWDSQQTRKLQQRHVRLRAPESMW